MTYIIYHNPRCSKSRAALAILEEAGAEVEIIEYLKNPLTKKTILHLQKLLQLNSLREMMRTKETLYKELNLKDASETKLLTALTKNPALLERPIVECGSKAVIGRPPELVRELFYQ